MTLLLANKRLLPLHPLRTASRIETRRHNLRRSSGVRLPGLECSQNRSAPEAAAKALCSDVDRTRIDFECEPWRRLYSTFIRPVELGSL